MDNTTVTQVEVEDIDAILNSTTDIITDTSDKKPNLFTKKVEDLSFLNKPISSESDKKDDEDKDKDKKKDDEKKDDDKTSPEEINSIINSDLKEDDVEGDKNDKTPGRPKTSKEGLVELTNKLIEKKLIVPFDDDKKIEDYTLADFEELFEANNDEREKKIREEIPKQFFNSLPEELQYAAKYVLEGGSDLKGLFRTLAEVEETKTLDPTVPEHQKSIIRTYLQATKFGTPEEIEEEITEWEDRDELETKAKKFKPKLDALSEQHVQYKVAQAAEINRQRSEQASIYMDSVYKVLEPGELNGLKLDKKTQNLLFTGLVQAVPGKNVNLLGELLQKYQFVEPNHGLVAEALWLLADPDGYKAKVKESAKKEAIADTVKKLKTEESRKIASHTDDDKDDKTKKPGIARPAKGFFARN